MSGSPSWMPYSPQGVKEFDNDDDDDDPVSRRQTWPQSRYELLG